MLFDVKVICRGKERIWQFGTNSNAVTDHNGVRRNPKTPMWREPVVDSREDATVVGLSVFLGFNCNLNCEYCYQKDHRGEYQGAVASPDKIPEFIEKVKSLDVKELANVSFWGGEPLVFWKTIEPLVLELEKLYPRLRFSIVTNGTLLTEDKIDFMKAHRFSVNVSCDGFPDERGYDLLLLKGPELKYLSEQLGEDTLFQACVSKGHEDVSIAFARFKQFLGENVRVSFAHPIRASGFDDPVAKLCIEDWRKFADSLYATREANKQSYIITRVDDLKRRIKDRIPTPEDAQFCGPAAGTMVSLDMEGTTYACHAGSMRPTGKIEKYRERDFSEFLSPEIRKAHCGECPLFVACRAGCPMTTAEGIEVSCAGRYGLAFAMFKSAWKELFDVEVVDITPHKENENA